MLMTLSFSSSWTTQPILPIKPFVLFLLLLISRLLAASGRIGLQMEQLVLRKFPSGCSPTAQCCSLQFRLCVGLANLPPGTAQDCLIVASNFSLSVRNSLPPDSADRTFVVLEFPAQHFQFTSSAVAAPNLSVELGILSNTGKMLLFSRQLAALSPEASLPPPSIKYISYGNLLVFRIWASCSAGFIGPGCATPCDPPLPWDHYECSPGGVRCLPGWQGVRCAQPVCALSCANGGRCVGPDKCLCPKGWTGPRCDECVPRVGCRNGLCGGEPGKCFCLPNWTGPDCDLVVDKCLERPCRNGGRCTTDGAHGDSYRCACPPGFAGSDCSISLAVCNTAPCGPNRHCIPLEDSFSCVCAPGFRGPECQPARQGEGTQRAQQAVGASSNSTALSSTESNLPNISNSSASFSPHWGHESGSLKALLIACLFLLLLILIILCFGNQAHLGGGTLLPCSQSTHPLSLQPRSATGTSMEEVLEQQQSREKRKHAADLERIDHSGTFFRRDFVCRPEFVVQSNRGVDEPQQRRLVPWAIPPPPYEDEDSLRRGEEIV